MANWDKKGTSQDNRCLWWLISNRVSFVSTAHHLCDPCSDVAQLSIEHICTFVWQNCFLLPVKWNRSVSGLRLPERFWLLSSGAAHALSISRQPGMNNDTIITGIHQSLDKLWRNTCQLWTFIQRVLADIFLLHIAVPGNSWRKAVQWQISHNYEDVTLQ